MKSDIEIAQSVALKPITEVVEKVGITFDDIELYGKYKAKLSFDKIKSIQENKPGKLVLVTAINPTPAGEGKSTMSIGLADALNKIGRKTMLALREPSLGPVMGIKGGAAGGGYAQVLPMEDINLHFTGDMHAITTQTMPFQQLSIITFIKETSLALTNVVLFGNVLLTSMTAPFVMSQLVLAALLMVFHVKTVLTSLLPQKSCNLVLSN